MLYISNLIYMSSRNTCTVDRQDEVKGSDVDLLFGAAMGQDGSVALAGTSDYEFQIVKLDAEGNFLWRFEVGVVLLPCPLHDPMSVDLKTVRFAFESFSV